MLSILKAIPRSKLQTGKWMEMDHEWQNSNAYSPSFQRNFHPKVLSNKSFSDFPSHLFFWPFRASRTTKGATSFNRCLPQMRCVPGWARTTCTGMCRMVRMRWRWRIPRCGSAWTFRRKIVFVDFFCWFWMRLTSYNHSIYNTDDIIMLKTRLFIYLSIDCKCFKNITNVSVIQDQHEYFVNSRGLEPLSGSEPGKRVGISTWNEPWTDCMVMYGTGKIQHFLELQCFFSRKTVHWTNKSQQFPGPQACVCCWSVLTWVILSKFEARVTMTFGQTPWNHAIRTTTNGVWVQSLPRGLNGRFFSDPIHSIAVVIHERLDEICWNPLTSNQSPMWLPSLVEYRWYFYNRIIVILPTFFPVDLWTSWVLLFFVLFLGRCSPVTKTGWPT